MPSEDDAPLTFRTCRVWVYRPTRMRIDAEDGKMENVIRVPVSLSYVSIQHCCSTK